MTSNEKSVPSSRRRAPALESHSADRLACFAFVHATDGRPASFANSGLLGRDRRQRVAQLTRMVEGDAGDDR